MKLDVTRDVISDLWPLCRSGDASAASRAMVDAFLAGDADLATQLREAEEVTSAMPRVRLSPEAERRLLDDARKKAWLKLLVIGAAIGLVGMIVLVAPVAYLVFVRNL